MKVKMLLLALTIGIGTANADTTINKSNGGPNGYDKVVSSGGADKGWQKLDCNNPGEIKCKFSTATTVGTAHAQDLDIQIIPYIEREISTGHLSGSYNIDASVVSWTATNIYNYSVHITP